MVNSASSKRVTTPYALTADRSHNNGLTNYRMKTLLTNKKHAPMHVASALILSIYQR